MTVMAWLAATLRPVRTEPDIGAFEGLVFKTAQMFASMVGLELDDLQQELRIKIVKASRAYDPTRSKMSERAYVYACVANFVKDLKRDAARRHNGPLVVLHVEDYCAPLDRDSQDWFEYTFACATHDEVFGAVEDGTFVMPSTVTPEEEKVLFFLTLDYAQTEIAVLLDLEYAFVVKCVRSLREKFADWRPTAQLQPQHTPVAA